VYGISPTWKGKIIPVELSLKTDALDGTAIRKEIRLTLTYRLLPTANCQLISVPCALSSALK